MRKLLDLLVVTIAATALVFAVGCAEDTATSDSNGGGAGGEAGTGGGTTGAGGEAGTGGRDAYAVNNAVTRKCRAPDLPPEALGGGSAPASACLRTAVHTATTTTSLVGSQRMS